MKIGVGMRNWHGFFALTLLLASPLPAAAQVATLSDVGVVLMHGKVGAPGGLIASTASALQSAGARVVMPEMPWSRSRSYDAGYEQAMAEIDRAVAQLRSAGAKRIVIAGQSFGANAAIGYAARRSNLAAVVALAPGHIPERPAYAKRIASSVAEAKQRVAAGKGDQSGAFLDQNYGKTFEIRATARVYLSYFDPNGPAPMPKNASAMRRVPLLWVIGRDDPLFSAGRGYAFSRAPAHPKSRYLEVNARHENTPDIARDQVVAWLKAL